MTIKHAVAQGFRNLSKRKTDADDADERDKGERTHRRGDEIRLVDRLPLAMSTARFDEQEDQHRVRHLPREHVPARDDDFNRCKRQHADD